MRKENSAFNSNFLSERGTYALHNNDYYGFYELEEFARYVIADGLLPGDNKHLDFSAVKAVEAVISAFIENPSIRSKALKRYLERANEELKNDKSKRVSRASVMVVVTDYKSLRYAHAGNCKFNLYRSGRLVTESKDHSLSRELADDKKIQKDKVARHEERNNLTMYCGIKKSFMPYVSSKMKLRDADVFSVFTKGIWENANTNDMLASVQSAENVPKEASIIWNV